MHFTCLGTIYRLQPCISCGSLTTSADSLSSKVGWQLMSQMSIGWRAVRKREICFQSLEQVFFFFGGYPTWQNHGCSMTEECLISHFRSCGSHPCSHPPRSSAIIYVIFPCTSPTARLVHKVKMICENELYRTAR